MNCRVNANFNLILIQADFIGQLLANDLKWSK